MNLQDAMIERVAKALAVHAGWDGWDTAVGWFQTLSGNEPEEERELFRDTVKFVLAAIIPPPLMPLYFVSTDLSEEEVKKLINVTPGQIVPLPRVHNQADVDLIRALVKLHDLNTCTHEETYRGGAIWTICPQCDRKWADDQGGFVPYADPPAVQQARALLESQP